MTTPPATKKSISQNSIDNALTAIVSSFTFQPTTSMWLVTLKSPYKKTEEMQRFVNALFNHGGISKFKYEKEDNGILIVHFSTYKHKFERALYPVLRHMMLRSRVQKLSVATGTLPFRKFVADIRHVKQCFLLRARKEVFALPASVSILSANGKFASACDSGFED